MSQEQIKKSILPQGVRVITENLPHLNSVALGVLFNHGSRDETETEQGISHFLEHMLFKGTTRHNAKEISIFAESKGTMIDGFTSKENTGIYCRFLSENFLPITDLTCEVLSLPLFAPHELEKEKGVIFEEIKSTLEDPDDQMLNLLFAALYEPHPMGFPVTGTFQTLTGFNSQSVRAYYEQNYSKKNTVVVGVGEIEHDLLCAKI